MSDDKRCYFVHATFERHPEEVQMGNWVHNLPMICRVHKTWGNRSNMFYKVYGDIVQLRVEERPYRNSLEKVFKEFKFSQRDMRAIARTE